MATLFPTEDLKKDFTAASGGHAPNPQCLFQDVEFHHKWLQLNDPPSTKAVRELRLMGVNIHGKKRRTSQ